MVILCCNDLRNNKDFKVKSNFNDLLKEEYERMMISEEPIESICIYIKNEGIVIRISAYSGGKGYSYRKIDNIKEEIDDEYVCYLLKYSYNELYNKEIYYFPIHINDYEKYNEYILDYFDFRDIRILKIDKKIIFEPEYYLEKKENTIELKKNDTQLIIYNKIQTNEFNELFSKINYCEFMNYYPNIICLKEYQNFILIYYFDEVIHFIERTDKTIKENIENFYKNFNCSFIRLNKKDEKILNDKRIVKTLEYFGSIIIKLNEKGIILNYNILVKKV
jgi:hypothetical protein